MQVYHTIQRHLQLRKLVQERFKTDDGNPPNHFYHLNHCFAKNDLSQILNNIIEHENKLEDKAYGLKIFIHFNNIEPQQCKCLSRKSFRNLLLLNIRENRLEDKGCQRIAKAQWPLLQIVYLGDNFISDQGCAQLTKANWKYLQILQLSQNRITEKGCIHLSKGSWTNLLALTITFNPIGKSGYQTIRNKFRSQCVVSSDRIYQQ